MNKSMALTAELVARCERIEPDSGPEEGYSTFTEEEYETAAAIHNMNRSRFAD